MKDNRELTKKLRNLLDRLAEARKLSNDEQEEVHDAVSAEVGLVSGDSFLEALDQAVGKSKSRRRESVYLLTEFAHLPEVVARIEIELKNPDARWRHWLVQTVGHKRLINLARQLTGVIEQDADVLCRQAAVWSAGHLRADECLPTLLKLAESPPAELRWSLTWALKEYASIKARAYLERQFDDASTEAAERVVAAWGLAKLGQARATNYLVEMLFDPDITTPTRYVPGQSLRAAQALCDLKGWPFEWNRTFVESHRDEWRKTLLSELEPTPTA